MGGGHHSQGDLQVLQSEGGRGGRERGEGGKKRGTGEGEEEWRRETERKEC